MPSGVEMKLLDMLAAILQNLASHPSNRTSMYRAELAGTAALDRVLEGPSSPEPTESSAALLAGRVTATRTAHSPRKQATSNNRSSSSAMPQPQRCDSPTLGLSTGRRSMQGGSLSRSLDAALSPGTVVRPKVVFPPISRSTAGMLAASSAGEQWVRAGSPTGLEQQQLEQSLPASPAAGQGRTSPSRQGRGAAAGNNPPRTATGARGSTAYAATRSPARNRSVKSRAATSVAGVPGSPMSAPDSREQFLIWMDSTFADASGHADGGSPSGAEPWFRANQG